MRSAGGAASPPDIYFYRRRSRSWRLGGLALALIAMSSGYHRHGHRSRTRTLALVESSTAWQ